MRRSTELELCGCGRPLHYVDLNAERMVRALIEAKGPFVLVQVEGEGVGYWVPRHFIALHGLKAQDLPFLASLYEWEPA